MNSYKNRNISDSTKEYLVGLEKAVNRNIPSMNGYFQKQYFEMIAEDTPNVDRANNEEICPHCGISYTHKSIKLKLKRKKRIKKNQSCSDKSLVITCKNCNMRTSKDSEFKRVKTKTISNKVKESLLGSNTNKDFSKTPISKTGGKNAMLLKNDVKTPLSSPFITPESAGSKSKRKRGKSFSPLTSQDQNSAKKPSNGKPSLLSFLTSL